MDYSDYNFGFLISYNTLEIYKKEELIEWICKFINRIYNLFYFCKINLSNK